MSSSTNFPTPSRSSNEKMIIYHLHLMLANEKTASSLFSMEGLSTLVNGLKDSSTVVMNVQNLLEEYDISKAGDRKELVQHFKTLISIIDEAELQRILKGEDGAEEDSDVELNGNSKTDSSQGASKSVKELNSYNLRPSSSSLLPPGIKIKPPTFDGTGMASFKKRFMDYCKMYIPSAPDAAKLAVLATSVEATPVLARDVIRANSLEGLFQDWEVRYAPIVSLSTALAGLVWTGDFNSYAEQFKQLMDEYELNEEEQQRLNDLFIDRLPFELRDFVDRSPELRKSSWSTIYNKIILRERDRLRSIPLSYPDSSAPVSLAVDVAALNSRQSSALISGSSTNDSFSSDNCQHCGSDRHSSAKCFKHPSRGQANRIEFLERKLRQLGFSS